MTNASVWLTEKDVTGAIDLNAAIDALENVLKSEAQQQAENMTKTHLMVGDNNAMHALGGAVHSLGVCGTKTWVNIDGKSSTMLLLFSLTDGACLAAIEATALGQMRTAAMTGLGTRWMADQNITEMAIIGTGKQALPQIAACLAVRLISKVRVFSRTPEKRKALIKAVEAEFPDLEVLNCESLEDAVHNVPLITLCTNATAPFFSAEMAAKGAHINAVGAIVPARAEFSGDIFPRCSAIAVDTVAGVKALSREFINYYEDGAGNWEQVKPISQLIADGYARPADVDLTLFKAMGMGISDVAIAHEVYSRCAGSDNVHTLPERRRQKLPLQTIN
ncbi:MAG: ornithine cyclodeaminase family protein [Rhodospirillaceae bacterium]|nr:ornithine cyclodeaminase family protein [Rhodospirillaceae bacterium]